MVHFECLSKNSKEPLTLYEDEIILPHDFYFRINLPRNSIIHKVKLTNNLSIQKIKELFKNAKSLVKTNSKKALVIETNLPEWILENMIIIEGIEKLTLVSITNLNGQLVLQEIVRPNQQIDISNLKSGFYIENFDGKTQKLIVE